MAVDAEYGPHLKRLFQPLFTGVGPVEAAVALTAELAQLEQTGALPDLVVSLGSAGSRSLDHAAVYQAVSVAYRDMDATALGFPKGVTPFLGLPAIVPLPLRIPGIPEASLATGASVVSGAAYDAVAADMVDMETFAHLRACHRFSVPLIALRGISDGKAELTGLSDWTDYLHLVDERLARAVMRLGEALAEDALRASGMRAAEPGN
jgi:adenosylhomocysteine nucleosidase